MVDSQKQGVTDVGDPQCLEYLSHVKHQPRSKPNLLFSTPLTLFHQCSICLDRFATHLDRGQTLIQGVTRIYFTLKTSLRNILAGSESIKTKSKAVIINRTIPQRSRNSLPFTLRTQK